MQAHVESAETLISSGFRTTGERLLSLRYTSLKGATEAYELRLVEPDLAESFHDLSHLLEEDASHLRVGATAEGYPRPENTTIPLEMEFLSQGMALTGRKLADLAGTPIPKPGEGPRPPSPFLRDRLVETGRRFLVVATQLEEAHRLLSDTSAGHIYLHRLEHRMSHELKELDDFLFGLREHIGVTLAELAIYAKKGSSPETVRTSRFLQP